MVKDPISSGTATAAAGARATGYVVVDTIDPEVRIPVTLVNGSAEGPTLVVTAGQHGAEYPSMEAARRFAESIDPAVLSGQVLVAHIVNPVGFERRSMYVSGLDDGKNMSRCFPGSPDGTATERLAHAVFTNLIRQADLFVDLEAGDFVETLTPIVVYHETPDRSEQTDTARRMALAHGIPCVIRGKTEGSAYRAAARAGIPALMAELGGNGLCSEDDVRVQLRGLENIAKEFGMIPGRPEPATAHVMFRESSWARAEHAGMLKYFVALDDMVREGQAVGEISDLFGRTLQTFRAPASGRVIHRLTCLSVREGDPLFIIGIPE